MKHCILIFAFIIAIFLIISGCASTTPLIRTSTIGDSSAVQQLINQDANVNEPDSCGYTPLMQAIWSGKTETVKVLLNKGADINAKDNDGYTPLLLASIYGYLDIARLLIDKGADVKARGDYGESSLTLACDANNTELAKLLIDKGVDINAEYDSGKTPIISAAMNGNSEIVKILIEKDVDLLIVDASGRKASNYVKSSNASLLKLLQEAETAQIKSGRVYARNSLRTRIISLVNKVSACINPDVNYTVYISNDKEKNASINRSRKITVTKGALEQWDEDVLTFFVAHEVAHDKLGHATKKKVVSFVTTSLMFAANFFVPGIVLLNYIINPAIKNNYNKIQEYDADKLASDYCIKCFNITIEKQIAMMKIIEKKSKLSGGGFWAIHPSFKNRIENIKISDYPYKSTDNFK